tara:strand:- start:131 stop:577 length:447 start_codon:yes stop_codon:yes gene_type:complete
MEELNNPESEVFRETLNKQIEFMNNRFFKLRANRYLDDKMGCMGTKVDIVKHLNQGPAQNLIQTFFNYKTNECSFCMRKKGDKSIRQFERAHCNNYSRSDILTMAVDEIYIDDKTPIIVGDILRKFIEKHDCCPIYMLCNLCHNNYDK